MKITKRYLKEVIKEELQKIQQENVSEIYDPEHLAKLKAAKAERRKAREKIAKSYEKAKRAPNYPQAFGEKPGPKKDNKEEEN